MHTNPWSEFKLRVNIRTDIRRAFECFTTPGGLESWFLRQATFENAAGDVRGKDEPVQEGDTYVFYWHGYPDTAVEKGKVLSNNGENRFTFTFSHNCPVTISIYPECGETIVELVESNLPTDEATMMRHYVGDSKGWIFYLTNLKSVLETGYDLRNRKVELTDVITA